MPKASDGVDGRRLGEEQVSQDDIRKLLGGYATNSLTDAERKALFEAALEDQELFDALNREQALKDLLDDPVSRDQIHRALEKPTTPAAWWSRWWTWTAAAGAVAASFLIFAVMHQNPPAPSTPIASVEELKAPAPAQPEAAPPTRTRVTEDKKFPSLTSAKPTGAATARNEFRPMPRPAAAAPAISAPSPAAPPALESSQQVQIVPAPIAVPTQSRGSDTQAASQQVAVQSANSLRDQEQKQTVQLGSGSVAGSLDQLKLSPLIYTLVKRDASGVYQPLQPDAGLQPGDAVRLTVTTGISGYINISRLDSSGAWTRVFPQTGPGIPVSANANYTIPELPITVTDTEQKLRLSLDTNAANGPTKAKTALMRKDSRENSPFVVDITIAPKKVP